MRETPYCGEWIEGMEPETLPVGVYFGMPFHVYEAVPAMRCSRLNLINSNPRLYWARHVDGILPDREATPAMTFGRAVHTYVIEGLPQFLEEYAAVDPLWRETKAEILELAPDILKASGKREDLISTIVAERPALAARIGDVAREAIAANGLVLVPHGTLNIAQAIKAALVNMAGVAEVLETGWPEVTVLWQDEYGTRWLDRLDKFGAFGLVELKTSMPRAEGGLPRRALRDMADRYSVQMGMHLKAMQVIEALAPVDPTGQPLTGSDSDNLNYLFATQDAQPETAAYCLNGKTAPGFLARAMNAFEMAVAGFYETRAMFGSEPYGHMNQLEPLYDEDCPAWMTGGSAGMEPSK